MHTAPLNQVDEAGVKDFLAIRKSLGLPVPEGQALYNTDTFHGYKMGRPSSSKKN